MKLNLGDYSCQFKHLLELMFSLWFLGLLWRASGFRCGDLKNRSLAADSSALKITR